MSNESKALELADSLESDRSPSPYINNAAAELRRQHAEIESLRAQLAARVPDSFLSELKAAKCVCDKSEKIDREKVYGRILAPHAEAMISAAPSQQKTDPNEKLT